MIRVHNNFESVRLSRHISHRIGSVRKSLARISSGMRITSAADDAAGSQISARLTSHLLQTQKELDGVNQEASLLQTLEGALSESEAALQRMREVALAAAGTALSTGFLRGTLLKKTPTR